MYKPPAYRIDSDAAAFHLISAWVFATLATVHDGAVRISQLPMIADPLRRILRGHLARANSHSGLIEGARATVRFTGPHGYI